MKQLDLINKINTLLSVFEAQIKNASAIYLYDINIISEDVLIPLFKVIFRLNNLRNINVNSSNYPGIDLVDDNEKVAFQITSTANSKKINNTLVQFFKHGLNNKYSRLYIYILKEKQKSYKIDKTDIVRTTFDFDEKRDIIDNRSLIKLIRNLDIKDIERIKELLENQFSENKKINILASTGGANKLIDSFNVETSDIELIFSNLLELTFPNKLYIADLIIDRKEIIRSSRVKGGTYLKNVAGTRKVAREALRQKNIRFANDWTCYENKLITFHDLSDDLIPLIEIIDEGTVEWIEPDEFYKIDINYLNAYKSLLRFNLQRYLYYKNVIWEHKDKLFVFMPESDELHKRTINWRSKVNATRTVFEKYTNDETGNIYYCKHLAFKAFFRYLEDKWYVEIMPDWFFTQDGYKRYYYRSDKIKWLKRNERNQHVSNHFKFIVFFLKEKLKPKLFQENITHYPNFLNFGKIVSRIGHPIINDEEWRRNEDKNNQKRLEDSCEKLPFELK